jgi:hypothetical protein
MNQRSGEPFTATDFGLKSDSSYSAIRLKGSLEIILDLTSENNLKPFLKHLKKILPTEEIVENAENIGLNRPTSITTINQLMNALTDPYWSAQPLQLGIPSNSQIFGQIARSAGIQGLLYKSRHGVGKCLAIYPDNLARSNSYIEMKDNAPESVIKKMDATSWRDLV